MFIEPATKDNTQVSRGRGKGGLAILWNKKLTKYVTKVKSTHSRLQAMRFQFPANSLLVINVYFPCDPRSNNYDDTIDLDSQRCSNC